LPVIVCGDFNGGLECGAVQFVEKGFVDTAFVEDGEPITSSRKDIPFAAPLIDVASCIDRPAPNTLVVPELISLLVKGGSESAYENPDLSGDVVERLTRVYDKYATLQHGDDKVMQRSDVEAWLIDINGQVGRGSEFREAARQMGWVEPPADDKEEDGASDTEKQKVKIELPSDGVLSLDGFVKVYHAELRQGKFWGIAHDLAIMGEALPEVGVYQSRFDRMYCTSAVQPTAIVDFVCSKPCPNEEEPSDHLPVAAAFALQQST
jgi:hypothetical protein